MTVKNPRNMAHAHDWRVELTTIRRVLQVVDEIELFTYKTIHTSVSRSYYYPWPPNAVKQRRGRYSVRREVSINRKLKQAIQRSETNFSHGWSPSTGMSCLKKISNMAYSALHWGDVTWARITQNHFFPSLNKKAAFFFLTPFVSPTQGLSHSEQLSIINP